MLEAAGLGVRVLERIGPPWVPAPVRLLFPATARRLAERPRRRRRATGRRRALQLVFAARKLDRGD
jgi:hypothetical protein